MMIVLSLLAQAVPPPVEQATADCVRPVFATDQLICGDPELRALDERLAALLAAVRIKPSRWIEPQTAWFKRRSRCAFERDHRACATSAYRERLAVLAPWPATTLTRVRCSDRLIDGAAILHDRIGFFTRGELVGVALAVPSPNWRPFLVAASTPRHLQAQGLAGNIRCRRTG